MELDSRPPESGEKLVKTRKCEKICSIEGCGQKFQKDESVG